jgi:membrane protein insertase Oxa1/YidC/SpoIIIJ
MLADIWFTFFFQPLFNILIYIYNTIANNNLGWAVIWLTIFLRIFLLPFSFISERNSYKQKKVEAEAKKVAQAFRGDPVAMQEEFRMIVKKNKISPWAKVLVLGVQVLVIVLLYQVFIQGITGERVIKLLYPIIDFPGNINVLFYGFNVGQTGVASWAFVAAAYLMVVIFLEHGIRKEWTKPEAVYLFLFPLMTFTALWYLPMVKSLFILTTMMFSTILSLVGKVIFPREQEVEKVK